MEKHQLFSLKKTEEKQLLLIMKFFSFFLLIGIGIAWQQIRIRKANYSQ